ncbi:NUCLEOLAR PRERIBOSOMAL-ASSOCIATED PROTEIN 1 [Salix koriyanagi]|uniref:NUCLEOLAR PRERIBOSOMAL-ASSOCIATED PROTEIN 1 n=1 Tax=Salix koriyanagi TaxID=2511006 RepID=A0A9Q0X0F1_9ROSI|nr:NUCLEOLAR PRERIBOSOMAL-ASSOCIATED PROTEIN 1 [Salix koriyanagi]
MCVTTVLHFPNDRTVTDGSLSLDRLQLDNLRDIYKIHVPGVENIQLYDPVFILRFAFHALSMGYIEAVEFAGLGLLAVAFVSMSSPDVGMRKLGYELIGKYKNVLENCQKTKDVMRLRLLLSYLQNGISESWQRIPSVLALFAAELSLILLDPSHDHYTTLSKHLMHSSKVNMKNIPLFHAFFLSNSVNFRMERLWMLRLARGGLNLDDDSQMFVRNSTIETLMSFYSSPLSDNESKEIILEIVKKAAKLPRMLLVVVIEVVNDVVSSRNIVEWLQNYALEQLMELATYLYKLLVAGLKLMKENVTLALDVFNTAGPSASSELGLKTILMGFPRVDIFHMNQEKLSSFLLWAVSTAMKSNSSQIINAKDSHANLTINLEETPSEESLISKLLRWLVASVILGKLSGKPNDLLGVNFTVLPSVVSSLYLLLCKSSKFSVLAHGYTYSLCDKIRCPPEVNPAWRWSFCQQWKDLSCEPSESQRMNEQHACQSLLVVISKILGRSHRMIHGYPLKMLTISGLYEWERIIAELKL